LVVKHFEGMRAPVETVSPWYVLMEWSGGADETDTDGAQPLRRVLEAFLADRFEAGVVTDAALATSEAQAAALWKFREVLPESQTREGGSIKHDVSVAVSRIPEFMESTTQQLEAHMPGIRVFPFGHAGDGNIHFNVTAPESMDKDAFYSHWEAINRIVHDRAMAMDGSFSAEHGIGQLKLGELACYGSAEKLDLMARLKAAIDPTGIMNPGKVLAAK
jgi:D-lactate dehydrogenase (cytochrome)